MFRSFIYIKAARNVSYSQRIKIDNLIHVEIKIKIGLKLILQINWKIYAEKSLFKLVTT